MTSDSLLLSSHGGMVGSMGEQEGRERRSGHRVRYLVLSVLVLIAPPPLISVIILPAPALESVTTTSSTNTTISRISLTDGVTFDIPLPTTITIITPTSTVVDSFPTTPHCNRTAISHIGPVSHLQIHGAEIDEPVPGAPTRPNCPYRHRTDLLGRTRSHGNLR
nr:unnamed protein product [Spirometra erinaceieuropaei]